MYLSALDGEGARMNGMANPGELSVNIVSLNKPKMLMRLEPNGNVAGTRALHSFVMDTKRYR